MLGKRQLRLRRGSASLRPRHLKQSRLSPKKVRLLRPRRRSQKVQNWRRRNTTNWTPGTKSRKTRNGKTNIRKMKIGKMKSRSSRLLRQRPKKGIGRTRRGVRSQRPLSSMRFLRNELRQARFFQTCRRPPPPPLTRLPKAAGRWQKKNPTRPRTLPPRGPVGGEFASLAIPSQLRKSTPRRNLKKHPRVRKQPWPLPPVRKKLPKKCPQNPSPIPQPLPASSTAS